LRRAARGKTIPGMRRGIVWLGWTLVGALVTIGLYGIFTIGIVLLAAAFGLAMALRRSGNPPAPALALGGALALIPFGIAALPYTPCTEAGLVGYPGDPPATCGGFNPLIYFVPAGALLVFSVGAALSGRSRAGRRHRADAR
jgi:hypothetical protein